MFAPSATRISSPCGRWTGLHNWRLPNFELQQTKAPDVVRAGRRTRARTRCGKQQGRARARGTQTATTSYSMTMTWVPVERRQADGRPVALRSLQIECSFRRFASMQSSVRRAR